MPAQRFSLQASSGNRALFAICDQHRLTDAHHAHGDAGCLAGGTFRGVMMCLAMRDDTGLAATRAGKNEQRPFGMGHRLALLRVEALEEIH